MLGETWSKKLELEFLECGANIAGLVELVDTGHCSGVGYNDLEFSVSHSLVKEVFRGTKICQFLENVLIYTTIILKMLL